MTKRCETMALEDVKEGICLCSKLLSKVMPSMKSVDKHKSYSSKDQRKDLEGSSEHELKEWSIIDLERKVQHDSKGDKSLENSQEVFVEDTAQSEVTKEKEELEVEKAVITSEKVELVELNAVAVELDCKDDTEDKYEDTQEELDEWSDFQEADQSNDNLRSSEFESESSNELTTVDEKGEGQGGKTLGRGGRGELHARQPFQSNLIQACVKYFQNFFARFVVERVLKYVNSLSTDGVNPHGMTNKECYTALRASALISDDMWKEMDKGDRAVSEKLNKDASNTQTTLKARRNVVGPTMLVSCFKSMLSSRNCAEAFVAACKLMLELSCFPVCPDKDSESEKTTTENDEGM